MSQFIQIHAENPQDRLIKQAVEIIQQGGVVVYPTDTSYAIGCHLGDKKAVDRIRQLRMLDDKHDFTLICEDLSQIASYARVDNEAYRILKSHTPGAYTFILKATKEVPKMLMHPKKKTIGIRVPGSNIIQAILKALGEPMLTSTLILPGDDYPMTDPYDIRQTLAASLDLIIDGGYCGMDETSLISLVDGNIEVLRQGAGRVEAFLP
ncbi:MAG: L-threonylcarbamoyladenylate synthase [Gammaproteobacteria bacterium]|nr:L-threonylcarbamoyladenylate synthase [Gammaproteobacteria bacterium]